MRVIKLQADKIFDGYRFHENKVLILQNDGSIEAVISTEEAGDDIQKISGILSPGFINCHCHLELSHLKNKIAENIGLAGFVKQVVQKRISNEEMVLQAIAAADQEMQQNGIVAVGDICNTTNSLFQKLKSPMHYHNFIEAMGSNPIVADKNFLFYEKIYHQFIEYLSPTQVSVTPHAPYSVSEFLFKKILNHNTNNLLSIHNQETIDEALWFEQKTGGFVNMFKGMGLNTDSFMPSGKSSLQTFLPNFAPDTHLLLVHNVYTTEEDIQFSLQQTRHLFWCMCPNANQYISQALPEVPIFLKHNCDIVLGTDSLASNHWLSIWEEIKTLQIAFPKISLEQMLRWATLNGAKALKIDDKYGSFEKGKNPGIVHIKEGKAVKFFVG